MADLNPKHIALEVRAVDLEMAIRGSACFDHPGLVALPIYKTCSLCGPLTKCVWDGGCIYQSKHDEVKK